MMKRGLLSTLRISENLNLSSSFTSPRWVTIPSWRSYLASIATKTAQRMAPMNSSDRPMMAGRLVSESVYIVPSMWFLSTSTGDRSMARPVPIRAMAS